MSVMEGTPPSSPPARTVSRRTLLRQVRAYAQAPAQAIIAVEGLIAIIVSDEKVKEPELRLMLHLFAQVHEQSAPDLTLANACWRAAQAMEKRLQGCSHGLQQDYSNFRSRNLLQTT
ncbi:MAG: hypothetical protein WC107_06770 [Patescibacteria group bacterium]